LGVRDGAWGPSSNWNTASDRRLKEDIHPYTDGLDLSLLQRINPVWFKYTGKGGPAKSKKPQVGVIAQEIQQVLPYTVESRVGKIEPTDSEETELLSFQSSSLTYLLVNAVKSLDKQFRERNLALEQENRALYDRVTALEAQLTEITTLLKNLPIRRSDRS